MNRFILRFRSPGLKPIEDIERIQTNARVLDDSSPRMLLVEAPEAELKALIASMPGWVMARERMISLPELHPRPTQRENKISESVSRLTEYIDDFQYPLTSNALVGQ